MKIYDRVLCDVYEDACCGRSAGRCRYPAIVLAVATCPYDRSVPMYLCALDNVELSAIWMLEPEGREDDRIRLDPDPKPLSFEVLP